MSFNEESLDKLDEFRLKLVQLRPQKFKEQLLNVVLTKDDIEEIFNEHRNPTSANKMSEMLDILKTKGVRGYNQFMKIVGKVSPELYTEITGQRPPSPSPQELELDGIVENNFDACMPSLEHLTIVVKKMRSLEAELMKTKAWNQKLIREEKVLGDKMNIVWRNYKVEKDKNKDRDRLEAERNDMMEQLTSVTGKALSYKEQLEIANSNLHELRLEHIRVKRELEKAQRGLKQQRQKSLQIERTYSQSNSRIREELQEKVSKLEEELKKIDRGQNRRSHPLPLPNYAKSPGTHEESNLTNTPINQQLVQLQTDLDIMTSDKQDAEEKAEDATKRAYQVIQELHAAEEKLDKFSQERDDLLLTLESQKDEAEMQKGFVMLAEHQLSRAIEERNQALSEKNLQTEKCARLMLQRDKLLQDQRNLRAEMTTIMEKLTMASTKLVKYKRRYRNTSIKLHGEFKPDYDEDTASTSSGSINDTGSYQVLDQEKDVNQPQQGEEEDEEVEENDQESNKRSSNATTESTNSSSGLTSLTPMQDSDDDLPKFRSRTGAYSKEHNGRRPSREQVVSSFPMRDFPDGASHEDDALSSPWYWQDRRGRIQNDSTKVHVHHEPFRNRDPLLGYESMTGKAVKRAKRRDRKASNVLNRRSKSFNDLSNISLDGEVNLDLELGLALQDQGSRSEMDADSIR